MARETVLMERRLTTDQDFSADNEVRRTDSAVRQIGILIFDGHCLSSTGIIGEAFQLANALVRFASAQPTYQVSLLSEHGGYVTSSSSISVWTQRLDAHLLRDFHALFVASTEVRGGQGSDSMFLRWMSGAEFANRPVDRFAKDSAYDAGTSSINKPAVPVFWFGEGHVSGYLSNQAPAQMALDLIATDLSEDISSRIARSLQPSVADVGRTRCDDLSLNTAVDKIHESTRWINENFSNDISVSDAAAVAAMSTRNYLRRFKDELGVTPFEYLTRLRFDAVCSMLLETELPIDKIARHCGMGNGDRLGRLFRKRYGMPPTAYRETRPHTSRHGTRKANNGNVPEA
jgi:transcriptional regulator GlxA family with amidase domain